MTLPIEPTLNPLTAVTPEPGVFPKERFLEIFRTALRPLPTRNGTPFRGVPVLWATDPRPFQGEDPDRERAWVLVSETGDDAIGNEELRTKYNAQANTRESLLVAQRQVTFTFRAFSLDPRLEAKDVLKRLRFYMNTDPVRLLMVPTIALVTYSKVVTYTDRTAEGRVLLAASMDLRMAYVEAADPAEQGETGFIETASPPSLTLIP